MSVTESERHQIFQWLQEVMGPERAAIMIELLPPVGWGDIATRTDLAVMEGRLRGEIAELRGEVRSEIGALRGEIGALRGEMGELRGEMGELRGEIGSLKGDLMRTLLLGVGGMQIGLVALVLTAVRFG